MRSRSRLLCGTARQCPAERAISNEGHWPTNGQPLNNSTWLVELSLIECSHVFPFVFFLFFNCFRFSRIPKESESWRPRPSTKISSSGLYQREKKEKEKEEEEQQEEEEEEEEERFFDLFYNKWQRCVVAPSWHLWIYHRIKWHFNFWFLQFTFLVFIAGQAEPISWPFSIFSIFSIFFFCFINWISCSTIQLTS